MMSGGNAAIVADEKSLAKRLQEARQAAGMTQQELCHRAELSYSTLAKIERGAIKAPSIFTIQRIAGVLDMTLDGLMGVSSPIAPIVPKKRSKSGIRFVYFDINGCLVRFFHRAFSRLAEETHATADVVETTFWHYNDAVCRGDMSLQEFNTILAQKLEVPELDWQRYYFDAIEPIQEMQELVRWASVHYNVGLLSNIMPGFIDQMLKGGMLPDVDYKAIIDSSEVGAIKPEAQIYEIAGSFADCDPSEILLVDDSRTNLMAAERADWHVLWFDDFHPEVSVDRVRTSLEPAEEI